MQNDIQYTLGVYREALAIFEIADDLADRGDHRRANLLYAKGAGLLVSLHEEALEVVA